MHTTTVMAPQDLWLFFAYGVLVGAGGFYGFVKASELWHEWMLRREIRAMAERRMRVVIDLESARTRRTR